MAAFAMLMLKWIAINNILCEGILIYIQTFISYEKTLNIVNFIFNLYRLKFRKHLNFPNIFRNSGVTFLTRCWFTTVTSFYFLRCK